MGIGQSTPRVSEARARYATASLSDALFTGTRQRVLSRLFGHHEASLSVSELIQSTGGGSGAVQRELARLHGAGLLLVEIVGNQKRYRPNPDAPIYDELVSIVRKTFGLADPLREVLEPLASMIRYAFIYGSVANRRDTSVSDIDLMVVSEHLGYPELMAALDPLVEQLSRAVNPTIHTPDALRRKREGGSSFLERVLKGPRIDVIGRSDDLAA